SDEDAREVVHRVTGDLADIRVSFGVASCPDHARDTQTLFRLADTALYEAKRNGTGLQFVASAAVAPEACASTSAWWTRPTRCASAIARARLLTSSFPRMCCTCVLTVRGLITS